MLALTKIPKNLFLKIGSRRRDHYSHVYEGKNYLKFEHEMKETFFQGYSLLLVSNNLEELEQKLSVYFLKYFGQLLPIFSCYMECLVRKLRPVRKQLSIPQPFLNLDYIKSSQLRPFVSKEN
jgi:hypothetical protein